MITVGLIVKKKEQSYSDDNSGSDCKKKEQSDSDDNSGGSDGKNTNHCFCNSINKL